MGRSKMTFIKVAQIVIVLCFLPIIKPAASKHILVETKGSSDYTKERKANRDFPFSEESCPPESPKYKEPCNDLGQSCMYGYSCCCGKCFFGLEEMQCVGFGSGKGIWETTISAALLKCPCKGEVYNSTCGLACKLSERRWNQTSDTI